MHGEAQSTLEREEHTKIRALQFGLCTGSVYAFVWAETGWWSRQCLKTRFREQDRETATKETCPVH